MQRSKQGTCCKNTTPGTAITGSAVNNKTFGKATARRIANHKTIGTSTHRSYVNQIVECWQRKQRGRCAEGARKVRGIAHDEGYCGKPSSGSSAEGQSIRVLRQRKKEHNPYMSLSMSMSMSLPISMSMSMALSMSM